MGQDWFENWFDSPYYDLLYAKRDEKEAALFLDNLLNIVPLAPDAHILDLACGKGRHSIYLNNKGYKVTGIDLSTRSINEAKKYKNIGLEFLVQDMRVPLKHSFSLILNLFTSFGYFADENDNLKVLSSVYSMLKSNGFFVLDFLNSEFVKNNYNTIDDKTVNGIDFKIRKSIENNWITKNISFVVSQKVFQYKEQVRLFSKKEFEEMFEKVGLSVVSTFGNYKLDPFNVENSERIIFVTKKW